MEKVMKFAARENREENKKKKPGDFHQMEPGGLSFSLPKF
jgi:hypothetical protein